MLLLAYNFPLVFIISRISIILLYCHCSDQVPYWMFLSVNMKLILICRYHHLHLNRNSFGVEFSIVLASHHYLGYFVLKSSCPFLFHTVCKQHARYNSVPYEIADCQLISVRSRGEILSWSFENILLSMNWKLFHNSPTIGFALATINLAAMIPARYIYSIQLFNQ